MLKCWNAQTAGTFRCSQCCFRCSIQHFWSHKQQPNKKHKRVGEVLKRFVAATANANVDADAHADADTNACQISNAQCQMLVTWTLVIMPILLKFENRSSYLTTFDMKCSPYPMLLSKCNFNANANTDTTATIPMFVCPQQPYRLTWITLVVLYVRWRHIKWIAQTNHLFIYLLATHCLLILAKQTERKSAVHA